MLQDLRIDADLWCKYHRLAELLQNPREVVKSKVEISTSFSQRLQVYEHK